MFSIDDPLDFSLNVKPLGSLLKRNINSSGLPDLYHRTESFSQIYAFFKLLE